MAEAKKIRMLLKNKYEDVQTTLAINKDLLGIALERRKILLVPEDRATISHLQTRVQEVEETYATLSKQNATAYVALFEYERRLESGEGQRGQEIAELERQHAMLTYEVEQKNKAATELARHLEARQRTSPPIFAQEKHLLDPTSQVLAMHDEFQINRSVYRKLYEQLNAETRKHDQLQLAQQQLREKNEYLKLVLKRLMAGADVSLLLDNSIFIITHDQMMPSPKA